MSLQHLSGLTRLECHTPGFQNIPEGTLLPLRVIDEEVITEGTRTAADGSFRKTSSRRKEKIIQLTAPDGTLHRFHTDPADAALATETRRQPAGRGGSMTVMHWPITTFVQHFGTPIPPGLARPRPADHSLLDLLEAIVNASHQTQDSKTQDPRQEASV
jgi:hypothetical protein